MTNEQAELPVALVGDDHEVPCVDGSFRRYLNLDAAASTSAMPAVAARVNEFLPWYSSVHRGAGYKSQVSTAAYEEARLAEQALDFDAHQLDIALRAASSLRDSSLIAHKLMELGMAFVASPAYLAQHRAPRTPEELEQHRLLLMMAPGGHMTLPLLRKGEEKASATVRMRPDVLAKDGAFLRQLALAGGGISMLADVLVQQDLAEKRLVRVLPDYRLELNAKLFLLHPAMHFVPPKVRAFRDFMIQALAPGSASPAGK